MTDKNPVFDLLQVESDDIECMVAYALYKRQKREWARGIREQSNAEPTPEQDQEFARVAATESSLDMYRQAANDMLVAFANQVVEDERPYIEEEAVPKRVETALDKIEASSGFLRQLTAGLIVSIVTISVLVALTIAAEIYGIDVVDESSIVDQVIDGEQALVD